MFKELTLCIQQHGAIASIELNHAGKTDFVAMVKQLIAEPEYALKLATGRRDEVTPCIRCYKCMTGLPGLPPNILCSVNPMSVREFREPYINPKLEKRKVLIAGGGVAGMKAAVTAAENGHSVTIVEKKDRLVGMLNFTDFDIHKEDLKRYRNYLLGRIKGLGINVMLNETATPKFVAEFNPDFLISAIGAQPVVPAIPGINGENVISALEIYGADINTLGEKITIIGGGLAGCEAGIFLAEKGKKVTILEMADIIAPEYIGIQRISLQDKIDSLTVCLTGCTCTAISPGEVTAVDNQGKEIKIESDTVVYATGMTARQEESAILIAAAKRSRSIGDCVKGRQVREAVHEAYFAAMDI